MTRLHGTRSLPMLTSIALSILLLAGFGVIQGPGPGEEADIIGSGQSNTHTSASRSGTLTFHSDSLVSDDRGGTSSETSQAVAFDSNGDIYVAWEDTRDGDPDIYWAVSHDAGGSFSPGERLDSAGYDGSYQKAPALAFDGEWNLYAVWQDNREGEWRIYCAVMLTGGSVFGDDAAVDTDAAGRDQTAPALASLSDGRLVLVFQEDAEGDADIMMSLSQSGGEGFTNRATVNDGTAYPQYDPDVAADENGNVAVTWVDFRHDPYPTNVVDEEPAIYAAVSTADELPVFGASARVDDVTDGSLIKAPSVALAPAGDPYVVWEDWREGEPGVRMAYSHDGGVSFEPSLPVDRKSSRPSSDCTPGIALDDAGGIAVVWKDLTDGNHTHAALSTDGGVTFGDGVQVDDKKHPEFSWQRDPMPLEISNPTITLAEDKVAAAERFFVLWEDCRDDPYVPDEWPEDHDIYLDKADVTANSPPVKSSLTADPLIDDDGVHLEWSRCADPDFGSYQLHRSEDKPFTPSASTLVHTSGVRWAVNYTDPVPNPGETYHYRVRTEDLGGLTVDSSTLTVTVPENTPPTITLLEPNGYDDTVDTEFTIRWTDGDPDDNASITLYYDADAVAGGETKISVISAGEDGENDSYIWDTSGMDEGQYYIKAVIDDMFNPSVEAVSPGMVTIEHADDNIAPWVVETIPGEKDQNVDVDTSIQVIFSEPVYPETDLSSTVFLKDMSGDWVSIDATLDAPDDLLTVTPLEPLAPYSGFTLMLMSSPAGFRDTGGLYLDGDQDGVNETADHFSLSFYTGPAGEMSVTSHYPDDENDWYPLDTTITIGFDRKPASYHLNTRFFNLTVESNGTPVETEIRWGNETGLVEIVPTSGSLDSGTEYTVTIFEGLHSGDGHVTVENYTFHFTTYARSEDELFGFISGRVTTPDGSPLEGADVLLVQTNDTTVSGTYGTFYFRDLDPGEYQVKVTLDGYVVHTAAVIVEPASEANVTIIMTPEEDTGDGGNGKDTLSDGAFYGLIILIILLALIAALFIFRRITRDTAPVLDEDERDRLRDDEGGREEWPDPDDDPEGGYIEVEYRDGKVQRKGRRERLDGTRRRKLGPPEDEDEPAGLLGRGEGREDEDEISDEPKVVRKEKTVVMKERRVVRKEKRVVRKERKGKGEGEIKRKEEGGEGKRKVVRRKRKVAGRDDEWLD